jgi:hypothetical protein
MLLSDEEFPSGCSLWILGWWCPELEPGLVKLLLQEAVLSMVGKGRMVLEFAKWVVLKDPTALVAQTDQFGPPLNSTVGCIGHRFRKLYE